MKEENFRNRPDVKKNFGVLHTDLMVVHSRFDFLCNSSPTISNLAWFVNVFLLFRSYSHLNFSYLQYFYKNTFFYNHKKVFVPSNCFKFHLLRLKFVNVNICPDSLSEVIKVKGSFFKYLRTQLINKKTLNSKQNADIVLLFIIFSGQGCVLVTSGVSGEFILDFISKLQQNWIGNFGRIRFLSNILQYK